MRKNLPIKIAGTILLILVISMLFSVTGALMKDDETKNSTQTRVEVPTSEDNVKDVEVTTPEVKAVTDAPVQSEPAEQKEPAKSVEQVEIMPDRSEDPYRRVTREEYEEIERSGIEKLNNWDGNTTPKEGVFNF